MSLAGHLQLHPGAPPGRSLVSTRPAGLARWLRGQPATALPGLLASLFSLCGPVHHLGATLALRSATSGRPAPPGPDDRRRLQWHTLCTHLQHIALDWPRWLHGGTGPSTPAADQGLAWLAGSPLRLQAAGASIGPDDVAGAARWLEARVFHQPLPAWLTAWRQAPQQALQAWAQRHAGSGPVAAWLLAAESSACQALPALPALRVHADAASLRALAADQPAWGAAPQWRGQCADTGPGARLADGDQALATVHTPWLRLGARLADLVQLALPDDPDNHLGAHRLSLGAEPTGRGGAIAWVETARGLLLQAVQLAPGASGPVVADVRVLAPTDWHAHPAGGWAQALSRLDADAPAAAVHALVAAYDPCVPCQITPAAPARPAMTEAADA